MVTMTYWVCRFSGGARLWRLPARQAVVSIPAGVGWGSWRGDGGETGREPWHGLDTQLEPAGIRRKAPMRGAG